MDSAPTAERNASPRAPRREAARILVVDDEESMRHFLRRGLRRLGYAVECAEDGESGAALWSASRFDLAVLDVRMPGVDGLAVLGRIRAHDPDAAVVLMTAHGTIATAVEAMKLGATDFVTKPFEIDELVLRIERALDHRRTRAENKTLKLMLAEQGGTDEMLGNSVALEAVRKTLDLLRDSRATVLITGESGTGKGIVARAVHRVSDRAQGPFVVVPCASLPDTLFESELFGHEAGAFTGALHRRQGLVARAEGGTLFFDEIGEMSGAAQAKIERFLQEREYVPLGSSEPRRADVRIVAATNRDMSVAARSGAFRHELLWRLDVVRIVVPPLRERREDVPLLVDQHLRRLIEREGGAKQSVTADAMSALTAYGWPGNVRELQNVVERMSILGGQRDLLGVGDLPPEIRDVAASAALGRGYAAAIEHFDRSYFASLLTRCRGNVTEAARTGGISRGHLHRRLRALALDPEQFR